jgi:hypothetical protein
VDTSDDRCDKVVKESEDITDVNEDIKNVGEDVTVVVESITDVLKADPAVSWVLSEVRVGRVDDICCVEKNVVGSPNSEDSEVFDSAVI